MRTGRLVFLLLAVFVSNVAASPRRGIVLDESGHVIANARIVVCTTQGTEILQRATATDGTFQVDGLPAGTYWLEVAAPQFDVDRRRMDVADADQPPLRIVLSLAPLQTEVTVTAQRGTIAEVDKTAPMITVREGDDFRQKPLATIANALEGAPGVMVQQSTNGQASPFLRGLTGYHVLNLIDGVRFNNSTFRSGPNQYLAFADPSQAQRIEVMLGPASAQFGSDALGGAIQVLTPAPRFGEASSRRSSADARLFASSADRSGGAEATFFLRGEGVSWSAGGNRRQLNDLRGGGGRDSHHVLGRLFGLNADQIQDITGERQRDTGFTQTGFHTKIALRPDPRQSVTGWYQRSEQDDVRGSKDLWGGLGRIRSDFEPQRLQFLYGRYERLALDPWTGSAGRSRSIHRTMGRSART
jgi:hemoglobin/transferrin/lactoferrin receptor protein